MFKVDIPLPPKEQAAIDARRAREQQRNARIANPRTLRMGMDTNTIISQVRRLGNTRVAGVRRTGWGTEGGARARARARADLQTTSSVINRELWCSGSAAPSLTAPHPRRAIVAAGSRLPRARVTSPHAQRTRAAV